MTLDNNMKYIIILLLSVMFASSEDESPFGGGSSNTGLGEMDYDFADIHKWDNVIVKLGDKIEHKMISWTSTLTCSHRGVVGKSESLSFYIDVKLYEDALKHPDLNRGVILMSGDTRFPSLYCWLRPLYIRKGKAYFSVSVPPNQLKNTQIAFSPKDGKKRYIYNLDQVVLSLKKRRGDK